MNGPQANPAGELQTPGLSAAPPAARFDVWLLARCRAAQVRNLLDQQLRDAPWRTLAILGLLVFIWGALYLMLAGVLRHIHGWGLIGVVADQHIFIHFFLVLAIMLAFSNAILTFGSLYGRNEAGYLLTLPVRPRHVVFVKWLEGMALSSWSFLLLGVPLMLAVAANADVEWYYYPLFIGHFVGFVAIPATFGLLAAWLVAMWAPRRPLATAIWFGAFLLLLAILWLTNISRQAVESGEWLHVLFRQISVVNQPFLPSTWTAKGILAAVHHDVEESLLYLFVVLGNAAFFAWLTINLLARHWGEAYSRAQQGRFKPIIRRGWFTALLCWLLFFYLPPRLRRLMLKDLRGFLRDAMQWTQMAILFGLLVIYVLNLQRLPVDLHSPGTKVLIAFLNLTTVSLILATFTSRFVYPLLSLESQQLWLLGLLPLRRTTMLLIKFLFALTLTGLSAVGVMALATQILDLPRAWTWANLIICFGVCVGLCGLAVGLGARFPVFGQRNPARIASSLGGTTNLILSMLFVVTEMAGVGYVSFSEFRATMTLPETLSAQSWMILAANLVASFGIGIAALWVGGRHFEKLQY